VTGDAVVTLPVQPSVLRLQRERDEAMKLLQRALELREMGENGPFKSDVRAFLQRVSS